MSQRVYQIRFGFGPDKDNTIIEDLISPTGLKFQHIQQLSIEAMPGFKFYINDNAIIVGVTGIYEVYLPDGDLSLRGDEKVLLSMQGQSSASPTLLINLVYDEEETESGEEITTDTL